jgi:CDP-4-dehydro-6-deoxyglucose reductase
MAGVTRRGRVIGRSPLSPRVTELTFRIEGDEPFRWLAGQHVTLRPELPLGDPSYYSIAVAPTQAGLRELTLAVANDSDTAAHAAVGSIVLVEGPFGRLTWQEAPGALLVGTGTAVAPLRAIAHDALSSRPETRLVLVAGNRTEEDLLWHRELLALAGEHSSFRYEPVVSRPNADWAGRRGRVQDHLRDVAAGLPDGFRVYLCGSERMVKDSQSVLGEHGVTPEQILSEAYG